MSYNVTEEVVNDTKSYISAGISELTLSHRVAISSNGNPFLEFSYANESGKRAYKTEWPVNDPKPFGERTEPQKKVIIDRIEKGKEKGKILSPEEVIKNMHNWDKDSQMKRILYVAKQFVPVNELIGNFANFKEFITFISNKIGGERWTDDNGIVRTKRPEKLRVKLVWDKNDEFITTPTKVNENEPWLERADLVSELDTKIQKLPTDKFVKSNGGYANLSSPAAGNKSPLGSDELPF